MLNSLGRAKCVLKHTRWILVHDWLVRRSHLCPWVRPRNVQSWILSRSRLRVCNRILLAAKTLLSFTQGKRSPLCMLKFDCLSNLLFVAHGPLFWAWTRPFLWLYFFGLPSSRAWGFSIVLGAHHLGVKRFLLFFGELLLIKGVYFFKNCVNFFKSFSCYGD